MFLEWKIFTFFHFFNEFSENANPFADLEFIFIETPYTAHVSLKSVITREILQSQYKYFIRISIFSKNLITFIMYKVFFWEKLKNKNQHLITINKTKIAFFSSNFATLAKSQNSVENGWHKASHNRTQKEFLEKIINVSQKCITKTGWVTLIKHFF